MKKLLNVSDQHCASPVFKLETDYTFSISMLPPFQRRAAIYQHISFTIVKSKIIEMKYISCDFSPNSILIGLNHIKP
jgi:hypothetical protein